MNKKIINAVQMIFGIFLFLLGGVFLTGKVEKSICGVCIGIGASLFGVSISKFWTMNFNKKHPDELKEAQIEFADERNTMIRNKAKAKSSDIIQWLIMGIVYITIATNAPLWVTLVTVGVFVLKYVLECYYMNKFQKEM